MIKRIDFVGTVVMGPGARMFQTYKPEEWAGWTVTREGEVVSFRNPKAKPIQSIEVPRGICVVHEGAEDAAAKEPVSQRFQQAAAKVPPASKVKNVVKDAAKEAESLLDAGKDLAKKVGL